MIVVRRPGFAGGRQHESFATRRPGGAGVHDVGQHLGHLKGRRLGDRPLLHLFVQIDDLAVASLDAAHEDGGRHETIVGKGRERRCHREQRHLARSER